MKVEELLESVYQKRLGKSEEQEREGLGCSKWSIKGDCGEGSADQNANKNMDKRPC